MKEYVLSEKVYVAIHNYLVTRPMNEIEGLVCALRQARTIETEEKPKQENKEKANAGTNNKKN